ncbi:hypothetical protein CWB63_18345 [Pseudoalteromonas sp. S409]|nr:hypothetical protein CWB64_07075 [Pseudoalteromonas sp. S410]TMN91691.1 hypothetical protein CWB62_06285 [Pseudoalteromonas sp. S408]TMN94976.1 hypothetical protein CWB63_18345 [Pseudoalteromonas sp. S409]TMN96100.1 hypothetical protein CWB61_13220 [Pseudoalteromonas sp. S407]TMO08985.1 hypothetical protein CWB57_13070 [Pseudoalteromonas sp. S186]TMO13719.1 hypothetical protein CWB56_15485 [Pseudoalteromonas sp. S185]
MKRNRKSFRLTDLAVQGLQFIISKDSNSNSTINKLLESVTDKIIYLSHEDLAFLKYGKEPSYCPITYYSHLIYQDIKEAQMKLSLSTGN